MKILAIETSCDDTGIAILDVKDGKKPVFNVLSNIVSSQQIHQQYGGVFPMMAKREHQKNLVPVLVRALKQSGLLILTNKQLKSQSKTLKKILEKESILFEIIKEFLEKYEKPDVDIIAVTHGPGLEPCLWVGVNFAKALSCVWDIPIVPVNHIEAHILVNFLSTRPGLVDFPAMSLVVSGGHTQLILMKGIGKYKIIGETRDDAAGECFDKSAKILGLEYPGGPAIAKIASQFGRGQTSSKLPRPMINSKDYDFSFSGLKTAILYRVRDEQASPVVQTTGLSEKFVRKMCFEVQQAILDVLIKKTIKAAKDFKVKTIILGGGVSANNELRKQFVEKTKKELSPNSHGRENNGIKVIFPEKHLSTDNALMIAVTGYFNRTKKIAWQKLSANANLRVSKLL